MSTAFALALLTTTGFYVVYQKLPRNLRRFIQKYSLLTDVATLIAVYMLLGGTLTALMAGAMCGIFVSTLLHIANNKEDFLYIYDLRDFIKAKAKEVKDALNAYGAVYRKQHLEIENVLAA